MPAYNAAKTIAASIDSVLDQTFINWELIIINDASIDDTASIIKSYLLKDLRIKLVSLARNGGLPNARNKGIEVATGEYLAFLDSDDIWLNDKLTEQVNFHITHSEISISHTNFDMFNAAGIKKRPFKNIIGRQYKKEGNLIPDIYSKNVIGVLTVVVKRNVILALNGFDANLRGAEDQDMWIRIAQSGAQFGYIDKTLALYRLSESAMTSNIGKYKRSYKVLIQKHKAAALNYNAYKPALANYYRYFGIVYHYKQQYKLALMYLRASIQNERYFLDKALTLGLYTLCMVKYRMAGLKR